MNFNTIGLILEIVFFFIGLYVYMLSRGMVKVSDPSLLRQFEALKSKHGTLIRILAILLMAVMFFNILIHIKTW